MTKVFPVIDPVATGQNIIRLRKAKGLTVRDLQDWFGFDEPQAIYKWQRGKSLPTIDNLYALGALLDVSMEEILVPYGPRIINKGQQASACCPNSLPGCFEYGSLWSHVPIFVTVPSDDPQQVGRHTLAGEKEARRQEKYLITLGWRGKSAVEDGDVDGFAWGWIGAGARWRRCLLDFPARSFYKHLLSAVKKCAAL